MEEMQKFEIEIDGVSKIANVIKILELNNKEYVVYTVDNGNGTSEVYYSEIVKDSEGYDRLVDVLDKNVRQSIMEMVNAMFS